jgi:hypothetical protein
MTGEGTRGAQGKGTHIGTLDICRARVVGDGIGGVGSEHGWGELCGLLLERKLQVFNICLLFAQCELQTGYPSVYLC